MNGEQHYIFTWKNNPVRLSHWNHVCRILARGARNSVLVEFWDGFRMVTSRRALRRVTVNPE